MFSLDQTQYEEHIKNWTQREQKDERGCRLDFQVSKDSSLAFKFSDLLKAEASANSTIAATLEGKSGRRLKIKKPGQFLRDEVITQDGIQEWIRTQASIAFKGFFGKNKFKAPEIWMVTGVQLVTEGDVFVGSSRSISNTLGASGDPGISFGAPPGMTAIGGEMSYAQGSEANNGYGYEGERVWAAQFMEVKIVYGSEEDKSLKTIGDEPAPATILAFPLVDIADLKSRGIRATQKQRADAQGRPLAKLPELVGRIVADDIKAKDIEDDTSTEDSDIGLGDRFYMESVENTDWEMYDEHTKYLRRGN